MVTSNPPPDISSIKLQALAQEHQRLAERYDALDAQRRGLTPIEELEHLHTGLSELRFADQALHPESLSLGAVRLEAKVGSLEPALLEHWLERLRRELDYGRRRASFAHLFGSLLHEWDSAPQAPVPGRESFEAQHLTYLQTPSPVPSMARLKRFFAEHESSMAPIRDAIAGADLTQPVDREELRAHLKLLTIDPNQSPRLRAIARAVKGDELQSDDYTGALTVLINRNPAQWRWPDKVEFRSVWQRERFRGYFDADLVTTLFLQIVGQRLAIELKRAMVERPPFDLKPRDRQPEWLNAHRLGQLNELFLPSTPLRLQQLRQLGAMESIHYEGFKFTDETPDTMQRLLSVVAADVDYLQKSQSKQVVAFHTDIEAFFATLPHAVALAWLEGMGLGEPWLQLVRNVLSVPTPDGPTQRGLPLNLRFSYLIADGLLRTLDAIVYEETQTRLIRFLDDIYFVTADAPKARRALSIIQTFLADCGLSANAQKSGSVCISSESSPPPTAPLFGPPEGLFEGPFRWGFLELSPQGRWRPHPETIDAYGENIRAAVERAPSVLAQVAEYNAGVNYLIRGLAPFTQLSKGHLRDASESLADFSARHFGQGKGIREALKTRLRALRPDEEEIHDGVLYWPITAGGLGLCNPQIVIASCEGQTPELTVPTEPPDSHRSQSIWSNYYAQRLRPIAPKAPVISPSMQGLRAEFILRGQKLLNNHSRSLTAYWEWLIQSYGPHLVSHFGAFSFLTNELVPVQLVVRSRRITSSLDAEMVPSTVSRAGSYTYSDDDIPF